MHFYEVGFARGEFDALIGLGRKSDLVESIYAEFSLDWRTLDWLFENHYTVFDTEFTGVAKEPVDSLRDLYDELSVVNLSNGYQAVTGKIYCQEMLNLIGPS